MEFAELLTFVTVAEERSFSKAAVRLCRTQPAVSMAVRRLEEQVGEQLFDRAARTPTLTGAGQVLLEYAARLFALRDEARDALRGLRRGGVVIGASEALAPALLPAIQRYRSLFPDVQVDVRRARGSDVQRALQAGDVDFGLAPRALVEGGLESAPLAADEIVVLLAPGHPLARRARLRVQDLEWEVLVAHGERSAVRDDVEALLAGERARVRVGLVLPGLDAIKRAVERGMGVTLLPRSCAVTEISQGRLVAVPLAESAAQQLWLTWPAGRLSAAAAAFLDCVHECRREATLPPAAALMHPPVPRARVVRTPRLVHRVAAG